MDPAFKATQFKKSSCSKISNKLIFQATYTCVCPTPAGEINNVTRYRLTLRITIDFKIYYFEQLFPDQ